MLTNVTEITCHGVSVLSCFLTCQTTVPPGIATSQVSSLKIPVDENDLEKNAGPCVIMLATKY